jgi:hypothetical protein
MFFKKRITYYNYLNCIQNNGSIIKNFERSSYSFTINRTYYLKFLDSTFKNTTFLKLINSFQSSFLISLNNKLLLNSKIDKFINIKKSNCFFTLSNHKMFFYINKINKAYIPLVFNNLFILKILKKHNKKLLFNYFFNL